MKLVGLSRMPRSDLAQSASHFFDGSAVIPHSRASASTTAKPMLWRVAAYSAPGLPSPATRRMRAGSADKTHFFGSFSFGADDADGCRGTFAFFLLLANHFGSSGSAFCCDFGRDRLFFNRRRQNGEDGEIRLNRRTSRLPVTEITNVNRIANVQRGNIH